MTCSGPSRDIDDPVGRNLKQEIVRELRCGGGRIVHGSGQGMWPSDAPGSPNRLEMPNPDGGRERRGRGLLLESLQRPNQDGGWEEESMD